MPNPVSYQSVEIPIKDMTTVKSLRRTMKRLNLRFTEITKADKTVTLEVYYTEPLQLVYLGAQLVTELANTFTNL